MRIWSENAMASCVTSNGQNVASNGHGGARNGNGASRDGYDVRGFGLRILWLPAHTGKSNGYGTTSKGFGVTSNTCSVPNTGNDVTE
jgi:hypothetical protein